MNTEQQRLAHIDSCIGAANVRLYHAATAADKATEEREIARLRDARTDVASRLTADEVLAYEATKAVVKTEEQLRVERARVASEMNENKDRPSH